MISFKNSLLISTPRHASSNNKVAVHDNVYNIVTLKPLLNSLCKWAGTSIAAKTVALALVMGYVAPPYAHADEGSVAKNAIFTHPNVARLRDQVCGYYAQVDIARSGKYPQIDLRLNGSSSLSSHIERRETNTRRLDDREVDAVIGMNQQLYDWGITDRSVRIAETNRHIARLDVTLETARQAADLLTLLLHHEELAEQDVHYQHLRGELEAIAQRIEDGVDAGALTLTNLRDIKINNLDIEVAHIQVQRELDLIETDLQERFKLSVEAAMPFLIYYKKVRPSAVPVIASGDTNEIRKLDLQRLIADFQLEQLKAQRKPALSAQLDTTFFDADSFSGEYEVVGRLQLSMPLYDGGSNKAGRQEAEWQRRSVMNERSGLIRNYESQTLQIHQTLKRIERNITNNLEKIAALEHQLDAHLAREGQTLSDPMGKASLLSQLNQHQREHISLNAEHAREFVRALFFADALGNILNLSDEVSTC